MAKKYKSLATLAATFSPSTPGPFDNRSVVTSYTDLTDKSFWEGYAYLGMTVAVYDDLDSTKNGLYRLDSDPIATTGNWVWTKLITSFDVPVTSVNNKTGAVTLTASDVGALPDTTSIPSKTSDLENNSDFITSSDIPAVNNKTLTIKSKLGNTTTDVLTFTANSDADKSITFIAGDNITLTPSTSTITIKAAGYDDSNVVKTDGLGSTNEVIIVKDAANKKVKSSGKTISDAAPDSNSTDNTIPTSKAVKSAIDTALTSVLKYKGTVTPSSGLPTTDVKVGDVYVVKTAGTYAQKACEVGDYIICKSITPDIAWDVINGENLVDNKNITLNWNATSTIATVDGTDITVKLPANPNTDTTYSPGTGLSLTGTTFNLKTASSTEIGGIIVNQSVSSQSAENISTTTGRTYAILKTSNGTAVVNVPWTNTDRYVNSASFAQDSTNNNVKMTLTRAGSDSATVVANIPAISAGNAGVVKANATVSSQTQSTKFLREDGTWAAPSYTTNTDTKVTSVSNHYSPTADDSVELTARISGTAGTYAKDTEYTVLTGVKAQRDAKGHITGLTYTAQNVKDTNTTYSSKTAANGGIEVSLVTTGEKYTWNNKQGALTAGTNISIANNAISAVGYTYNSEKNSFAEGQNAYTEAFVRADSETYTQNTIRVFVVTTGANLTDLLHVNDTVKYDGKVGKIEAIVTTSGPAHIKVKDYLGNYILLNTAAIDQKIYKLRAYGEQSHVEGADTYASGDYSHASGCGTIANQEAMTAIGKYNELGQSGDLFVVGNGRSNSSRSNAFKVTNAGTIVIGDNNSGGLKCAGATLTCLNEEGDYSLYLLQDGKKIISYEDNKYLFGNGALQIDYSDVTFDKDLIINNDASIAGDLDVDGSINTSEVNAKDGFFQTSDIRKKNIISDLSLDKAYDLVDKCQTIIYTLKDDKSNKEQIGLIAQEVQEFFPEIISENEAGELSLDYSKLTVVILKVLKDLILRISEVERKLK